MYTLVILLFFFFVFTPHAGAQVVCPANVLAAVPGVTSCWPLQEPGGVVITDTLGVNTGAISGTGYTMNTGGGIACNNATSSGCDITTPTNYPNPQPFTVYADFVGTSGGILQLGSDSSLTATAYYVLFLDTHGKLTFGSNNFGNEQIVQTAKSFADGNEHKVAVTLGASGAKIYADGQLVASSGVTLASYAAGKWFFGGINTAGWPISQTYAHFNGTLITVAWWDGAQLTDQQAIKLVGGLPTAIASNYCTFSNQIASLDPHQAMAYANKKLTFKINSLQVPGSGSTLPIGPSTEICQTDSTGNILSGCQVPQGAHVTLSVGSGPPIPMVIPAAAACDLTAIVLSQTDPPQVVSAVAVAGPLFAGSTVTNPPAGTIGTATITAPNAYSQTQAANATVDIGAHGPTQQVIMTGNVTVALTNFASGAQFVVDTTEDAGGGRLPTFTVPGGWSVSWPGGGTQPVIPNTAPNQHNLWQFNAVSGSVLVASLPTIAHGFPLTDTANFNNYSGINIGGLQLIKQQPPGNFSVTATCGGACATPYQYEVTCVNDTGESNVSTAISANNAVGLDATHYNVSKWALTPQCYGGYNVYGRTAGSLALLATVPVNGNPADTCSPAPCYTDDGSASTGARYSFTWGAAAYPAVAIWDLAGVATGTQVDQIGKNNGVGNPLTTASVTTTANHNLQIPVFGYAAGAGAFIPPGGFASTIAIGGAPGQNYGLWGGTKDITPAGATGVSSGTTVVGGNIWNTLNLALFSPDPHAAAPTVSGTDNHIATSPYQTISFGDVAGAITGDTELVCVSFAAVAGAPVVSPGLTFVASINRSAVSGNQLNCYLAFPTTSGTPPPTANLTGVLTQLDSTGQVFREIKAGMIGWAARNNEATPNSVRIEGAVQYPVPLTVVGCNVAYGNWSACAPYPVFAIRDDTAGVNICSVQTTNVDSAVGVTPSVYSIPAQHMILFRAVNVPAGCAAGGEASMSIVMHQ